MAEKKFGSMQLSLGRVLATQTLVMQARLLKMAGPLIHRVPQLMSGFGKDKSDEDKARSNIAAIQAFGEIFASADPEELADMIKDLVQLCRIKRANGDFDPVDFDGDFSEEQGQIIPVVVWVLREVFGDFFSGVLGIGNLK